MSCHHSKTRDRAQSVYTLRLRLQCGHPEITLTLVPCNQLANWNQTIASCRREPWPGDSMCDSTERRSAITTCLERGCRIFTYRHRTLPTGTVSYSHLSDALWTQSDSRILSIIIEVPANDRRQLLEWIQTADCLPGRLELRSSDDDISSTGTDEHQLVEALRKQVLLQCDLAHVESSITSP